MNFILIAVLAYLKMCNGLTSESQCKNEIVDLEKECTSVSCVEEKAEEIIDFWTSQK